MLEIKITGGSTATCDSLNVSCHGTYSKNGAGVATLSLKKDDYLQFEVPKFNGHGYFYRAQVSIAKDAPDRVWFLNSDTSHLNIWFDRSPGTDQFYVAVSLLTKDEFGEIHEITGVSDYYLTAGPAEYVNVYILDGDLFITTDSHALLWRRFETRVWFSNGVTSFGGPLTQRNGGFGISNVMFSVDIRRQKGYENLDEELEKLMGRTPYGDFLLTNAYYDAADSGLTLGDFKSRAKGTKGNIETVYKYANGVILKSKDNEYSYLSAALYKDYSADAELKTFPGSEQVRTDRDDVRITYTMLRDMALFHSKATVNGKTKEESAVLPREILNRYMASDLRMYVSGYPVSADGYNKVQRSTQAYEARPFSSGKAIVQVSPDGDSALFKPYTVILPCELYQFFINEENYKRYDPGMLLADYSTMFGKGGEALCYSAPCGHGWIYYFPTWGKCAFSKKHLGDTVNKEFGRSAKGIAYLDFENGVAVNYPDSKDAVIVTDLVMELINVTAKKMYYGMSTVPNIYLEQTVYTDAGTVCNRAQLGKRDAMHASPKYDYNDAGRKNLYTVSPVRGNSFFRFVINVFHNQGTMTNPALGCFDYSYDIDSHWGVQPETQTQKYLKLSLTKEESANRGGLSNVILTLKFTAPKDPDPMKAIWRKDLGLPLYDFKSSYQMSAVDFTRAFLLTGGDGLAAWMYSEALYKMGEGLVRDGKSYGFACAELTAAAREGFFLTPSLSKYAYKDGRIKNYSKLDRDTRNTADAITDNALKRIGWDTLCWRWSQFRTEPENVLKKLKQTWSQSLASDGCMITLKKNSGEEHTQVAYRIDYQKGNSVVYVKDCNAPYDPAQDAADPDATYLTFRGNSTKINAIVPNATGNRPEFQKNIGFRTLMPTTSPLAIQVPRVPTPIDMGLISGIHPVIVMIEGNAEITLVDAENGFGKVYENGAVLNPEYIFPAYDGTEDDGTRLQVFLFKDDGYQLHLQGTKQGDVTVTLFTAEMAIKVRNYMDQDASLLIHGEQTHALRGLKFSVMKAGTSRKLEYSIAQSRFQGYYIRRFEGTTELHSWMHSFKSTAYGNAIVLTQTKGLLSMSRKYLKSKKSDRCWKPDARLRTRAEQLGGIANRELTVRQAALIFGCSESTVRKYCQDGTLRGAHKVGFGWRIPRQEMIDK